MKLSQQLKHIDIPTILHHDFYGKVIYAKQEKRVTDCYVADYQRVRVFCRRFRCFGVASNPIFLKFIQDFESITTLVKKHNSEIISCLLDLYKEFFDHVLHYPLDEQQRRSIISEEENCLVISSAGSGKTSSILGKVRYLIEIKGIDPRRIALISYTNKASLELTKRLATDGLRGYTFHKLAVDLIGSVTGVKPSICSRPEKILADSYQELLKTKYFKKNVLEYFANYGPFTPEWEFRDNFSEQKEKHLKAVFPDMDGKTIYVRSKQEQTACFILSSLGISFRYEEPYEFQVADATHSQYRPDFSLYVTEQNGSLRRIYLELFAINKQGRVPPWFVEGTNKTYEEVNQIYLDEIDWKNKTHKKFKTELLALTSADFSYSNIQNKLRKLLEEAGIPIQEKKEEELYHTILPKQSSQEKAFIKLVIQFISLMKSTHQSIKEVLYRAKIAKDNQSSWLIEKVLKPIYEHYVDTLAKKNQIDFTDAILRATEICRSSRPEKYDYIIVDEFQDISAACCHFLKELRKGNPPAKMYCVGDDWQSIYRFAGSDVTVFNQFSDYFGPKEVHKLETTYRLGEPLVSLASGFVQRNNSQIRKDCRSFNPDTRTELVFIPYCCRSISRNEMDYCSRLEQEISKIPEDKSILLLGRYSSDDYLLSQKHQFVKTRNKLFYIIGNRKIEFLTVHKAKGLEADYVILLQCNAGIFGFPSIIKDNAVLNYVLAEKDSFPFSEERRLFYVAITRAKIKTIVLYDKKFPSEFVKEFVEVDKKSSSEFVKKSVKVDEEPVNAYKVWTRREESLLLQLYKKGESAKDIATKMGRSPSAIRSRLRKLQRAC